MRISTLAIVILLSSHNVAAQKNHVLNPSFEIYDTCPKPLNDQIHYAKFWSGIDSTGFAICTPEFMHECAGSLVVGVPYNGRYYQYARTGKGMAQVSMFSDESKKPQGFNRDYLQGRFSKPLTAGKSYCISFYVCLEEYARYAIKEIGVYLDNGTIDTVSINCAEPKTQYVPQIQYSDSVITDTLNWTKVEGSIIANGTEHFITIGNFLSRDSTTFIALPNNGRNAITWFSLYLVDDVSVVESDLKADAGPDVHVGNGDSVFIGFPDKALDCTWYVLGSSTVIGKEAGIWVKPTVTTKYVLKQIVCGQSTQDTVEVEVWKAGLTSIAGQLQSYALRTNPVRDEIELVQRQPDHRPVAMMIYDNVGHLVGSRSIDFMNNQYMADCSVYGPGCYYLSLQDASGNSYWLRFVKQ